MIWAKISDAIDVKSTLLFAMFLFAAFSGACGAVQTMTQLYVAAFNSHNGLG